MSPRLLIFASIVLLSLLGCRSEPSGRLLVYVMAGQSNMAGRGVIAPEDSSTDPRILMVDADMALVPAREPLHFYQPGFEGLDCGMSFARTLLEHAPAGTRICLVPCAVGNTSIEEWIGDSLRVRHLFSNAVRRTDAGIAGGGTLAGILWHQGESNAETADRSRLYGQTLDRLVFNFQDALRTPGLPFYAATLADFCKRPFKDSVNAAIAQLARQRGDVFLVSTADLSCKPDSVHFDAAAQRELGRRFALAAAADLK
jgi:hypothetical protein